jgi:hypothetical protein
MARDDMRKSPVLHASVIGRKEGDDGQQGHEDEAAPG